MTMMKVRLGNKKEKSSLRPLTEKEIQKKLYGTLLDSSQEEPAPPWVESPRRERERSSATTVKSKKIRISLPKVSIPKVVIPWARIGSGLAIFSKGVFSFTQGFFIRVARGWGLGVIAVVLLFVVVHSLNSYRTTAMKSVRPRQTQTIEILRKKRVPKKRVKPAVQAPEETAIQETQSDPPVKREVLPSLVLVPPVMNMIRDPRPPKQPVVSETTTENRYVIQVCTYSSEEDARQLVEQMKGLGFSAFVHSLARANGKTFYLVFLGRFDSFREAQARLKEFRSQPVAKDFPDSFIREL